MVDSKVEVFSRSAEWSIDGLGPSTHKKSDPFKVGLWNWILTAEQIDSLYLCLFPEPSNVSRKQPPFARFTLRLSVHGPNPESYVSHVHEKFFQTSEDVFIWFFCDSSDGRLCIGVEFLELKAIPQNGREPESIWPSEEIEPISTRTTLHRLSRMFSEAIHADATINMADGSLSAHKAILSASSQVFRSMFSHDLKEKESSTIQIDDMSLETGTVLLSYLYGTIEQKVFLKHRISLIGVANKYMIVDLKDACEESLMEDIDRGNVLVLLQEAWLYQLEKLKKRCMMYLFKFAKAYGMKREIINFSKSADRELVEEMFNELLSTWKPS